MLQGGEILQYPYVHRVFQKIVKPVMIVAIIAIFVSGIGLGFTLDVSAEEGLIPSWIKNTAGWWAEGQIGDEEFLKGIEFLLNENIIKLTSVPVQQSENNSQKIPEWVKNNAGWWANGDIDDKSFVQGLQYLIENGIIAYTPQNQPVETETKSISLLPAKDDLNFKTYSMWKTGCEYLKGIPENLENCEHLEFVVEEDELPIYGVNIREFKNSIFAENYFEEFKTLGESSSKSGGTFNQINLEPSTRCLEISTIIGKTFLTRRADCIVDSYVVSVNTFTGDDKYSIVNKLTDVTLSKIFKGLQIENYQTLSEYSEPVAVDKKQSQGDFTKRIDGERADEIMGQWVDNLETMDEDEFIQRMTQDPSKSQFHLGIIYSWSWQGALSDGTSIRSIDGYDSSLIPFKCQDVGTMIYNMNIQKQEEQGDLLIIVIKNEIPIDSAETSAAYGVVSLSGNCSP